MREKYQYFFDLYLSMCKNQYNPEKPYDNLENCIKTCNSSCDKLMGMITLLEDMGEISPEEAENEIGRIIKTFSSISICNAYMEDGEIMVFS